MAADQQFCLRWNNHQSTLIQVFDTLLASEQLVDCTLAAEGQYLKAHKVVLSACSPYLELLLAQHYEKHPIVILKDVKFQELKSMMDYMYRGEVNISQDQLSTFLKAAESLQIKGLTDSGEDSRDVGSTKRVDGAAQGARKAAAATGAAAASSGSNRASPAVGGTGLTIEPRPASPHHRDASLSPTPRKRRRARRPSQGDAPDSHNDTSNSCDLPPASALAPPEQHIETEHINNRLQNSNNMELIKEKVEPTPELMIEPKTEYMDENNEDSVEDLTLDDDDDLDMNRSGMDMGRPGPSHGDSNQGFATSWHMQGDRSGTDEVFMAAQEAVGAAHRDSQDVVVSIKKGVKEVTVIRSQPTGKIFVKPDSALFPKAVSLKQTNPGTDAILRPQTKLRAVMPKDASKINLGTLTNPRSGMVLRAVKPGVAPKINSGAETHPRAETNTGVEVNFGCETNAGAETDLAAEASTALAGINSVSENNGGADIATPTHLESQYLCTNCGKSYESKGSFKRHIKMVCDNKTTYLLCEHCPFKTKWPDSMKMHALMKHDSQIKGKLKNILQKKNKRFDKA